MRVESFKPKKRSFQRYLKPVDTTCICVSVTPRQILLRNDISGFEPPIKNRASSRAVFPAELSPTMMLYRVRLSSFAFLKHLKLPMSIVFSMYDLPLSAAGIIGHLRW